MKHIKQNITTYILYGHYIYAKTMSFDIMAQQDFYDLIVEVGFETESIAVYTFICYLLITHETVYLHQLAAVLISQALSHVEGAYSSGLHHARCAIRLEPNNISHKEYLLLFNSIPDKLVDDIEAQTIAQKILEQDPTNVTALKIIFNK